MLANEVDWCHEDRAISLPSVLIPIARAARLHYEGLSFAYLLASRGEVSERGGAGRVVAPPVDGKGKRQLTLCHAGDDPREGSLVAVERLERHRGTAREVWGTATRGSILELAPWPAASGRLAPETEVRFVPEVMP